MTTKRNIELLDPSVESEVRRERRDHQLNVVFVLLTCGVLVITITLVVLATVRALINSVM